MLRMPASVTAENAVATRDSLAQGLREVGGPEVVVDASSLERFDSSALAVLLDCERLAVAAGKRFNLSGMPARLASLATLYGVGGLLLDEQAHAAPVPAP